MSGIVYILVRDERICYVGQTVLLPRRLYQHRVDGRAFDLALGFRSEWPRAAEAALIRFFRPSANTDQNGPLRPRDRAVLDALGLGSAECPASAERSIVEHRRIGGTLLSSPGELLDRARPQRHAFRLLVALASMAEQPRRTSEIAAILGCNVRAGERFICQFREDGYGIASEARGRERYHRLVTMPPGIARAIETLAAPAVREAEAAHPEIGRTRGKRRA